MDETKPPRFIDPCCPPPPDAAILREEPTAPLEPLDTPRKRRPDISRQQAKRVENLVVSYVNREVGTDKRRIAELEEALRSRGDDVLALQRQVAEAQKVHARLMMLVEAFTRRHGRQVFSTLEVWEKCRRGRVTISQDQTRITVELCPDLEVVADNSVSIFVDGAE
jgi:hypothetical protein